MADRAIRYDVREWGTEWVIPYLERSWAKNLHSNSHGYQIKFLFSIIQDWVYDTSVVQTSASQEFDIVCDKGALKVDTQMDDL